MSVHCDEGGTPRLQECGALDALITQRAIDDRHTEPLPDEFLDVVPVRERSIIRDLEDAPRSSAMS